GLPRPFQEVVVSLGGGERLALGLRELALDLGRSAGDPPFRRFPVDPLGRYEELHDLPRELVVLGAARLRDLWLRLRARRLLSGDDHVEPVVEIRLRDRL